MKSMTGHGRGEVVFQGRQIVAEIHSVNRKQLELVFNLSRALPSARYEAPLRDLLMARISRGRATLAVQVQEKGRAPGQAERIDPTAAVAYHRELESLRRRLKIKEPVPLELVLRGPGVLREGEPPLPAETWLAPVTAAVRRALEAFSRMREAEGRHLADDLLKRLREMEAAAKKISRRAPRVIAHHREALRARLAAAGIDLEADDERLVREAVLFADRSDVSEELTRLGSHFAQFRKILGQAGAGDAGGRTLEFLTQELNREINTIGSKANDVEIAHHVVEMKSALEKIREQIQNFE